VGAIQTGHATQFNPPYEGGSERLRKGFQPDSASGHPFKERAAAVSHYQRTCEYADPAEAPVRRKYLQRNPDIMDIIASPHSALSKEGGRGKYPECHTCIPTNEGLRSKPVAGAKFPSIKHKTAMKMKLWKYLLVLYNDGKSFGTTTSSSNTWVVRSLTALLTRTATRQPCLTGLLPDSDVARVANPELFYAFIFVTNSASAQAGELNRLMDFLNPNRSARRAGLYTRSTSSEACPGIQLPTSPVGSMAAWQLFLMNLFMFSGVPGPLIQIGLAARKC